MRWEAEEANDKIKKEDMAVWIRIAIVVLCSLGILIWFFVETSS